ncbi:P1 family peptidase [Phenylobacterium sp. RIFCSPHIGHO2_01_FULL_69_31]|uniref:DmpA family aminopeptidase n=1 Tax=Phenylobacterium sp. RIFCSPHIGHO2_01_FULL_69_31 TaxID=1801944 RepID=UPI000A53E3AC|nr:P1 family peptidase [Phenylobacterium sp. RIFCSPHIGHO2_01_FULL_69_31]
MRYGVKAAVLAAVLMANSAQAAERPSARDLGVAPGVFAPGPANAITDVAGVKVGQVTRIEGADVRTGVTAILPHGGNLFQDKVPAGVAVANGFGKLTGTTQILELGEIETPIVLTNTLSVWRAADALVTWTLGQPGNEQVRSVNVVVGETNDGYLNNIRKRAITAEDVLEALRSAKPGPVEQGAVGAGTGTMAFDWKGGVGSSSRVLPAALGGYTVGVLVQSNYGGTLAVDGDPVGRRSGRYYLHEHAPAPGGAPPSVADGSIMIVIATDAPLSDRNLERLAKRSFAGLARTGSAFTNGSGDYAIAFSTADQVRRTPARRRATSTTADIPNDQLSPLFVAVADATEEAIYNSLLKARTIESRDLDGKPVRGEALDPGPIRRR